MCCGGRSVALIVGWFQTISSTIGLILMIVSAVSANKEEKINAINDPCQKDPDSYGLQVTILIFTIFSLVLKFTGGILLLLGVRQSSPEKIKVWALIQGMFLDITMFGAVLSIFKGNFGGLLNDIFGITATLVCICLVNSYRKHLKHTNDNPSSVNATASDHADDPERDILNGDEEESHGSNEKDKGDETISSNILGVGEERILKNKVTVV